MFKKSCWIKEVNLIYIPSDCCDILELQAIITLGWLIKEKLYEGYWWKGGVSQVKTGNEEEKDVWRRKSKYIISGSQRDWICLSLMRVSAAK